MRKLTTPRIRRTAVVALGGLCIATAAIGWMHTPSARLLLAKLGVPCPVDHADPKLAMALRDGALALSRGTVPAPSRPALGLQLDATTYEQVSDWAKNHHAKCDAITRGYHYLRCRGVSAAALGVVGPPVSEVWFSFSPGSKTLVAVNLYRRSMTEAQTRQSWRTALQDLRQALGAPTQSSGDLTLASLEHSAIGVASVQYTYSDYIATVTASHLPYGGLAVREQYMSAVVPSNKG